MLARRCLGFSHSFVTLCAVLGSPLQASVGYIVNCCNHSSTASVFSTATGNQTAQWTVGQGANDAVTSPNGRFAYISNTLSQSVSVVKVATGETLATISAGYAISWMTISKDGARLFAQSYDGAYESHIVEIDTITNTVIRATGYPAAFSPMALSPDGSKIYVDAAFSSQNGLYVISTQDLSVTTTIPVGAANGVAITPDGKFVYVPNLGLGGPYMPAVAVVDTSTNAITTTIPLNTKLNPSYAAMSPDGSMLWVSEFPLYGGIIPVIDVISTATNQIVGHVDLLGEQIPAAIAFGPSGNVAYVVSGGSAVQEVDVAAWKPFRQIDSLGFLNGLAITPDGKTLILPNSGTSQVAAFTESASSNVANTPAGAMNINTPQLYFEVGGAASGPDGSRVYVTNYASSNVSIVDTASKQIVASVEVGSSPVGVVVSPDGSKAYVANASSNSLTVVNTTTYSPTQINMPEGTYLTSIAISPDGTRVYAAGSNIVPDFGTAKCYIYVIDTGSEEVIDSIRIPYPSAVAVSPDGSHVYVTSTFTELYTISTATDSVINELELVNNGLSPPGTTGLAITADGAHAYLDDGADNTIFEVDLAQNKVIDTIKAGKLPGILAISPDQTELWAGDFLAASATVIDISAGKVANTIPLGSPSFGIAFAPQ